MKSTPCYAPGCAHCRTDKDVHEFWCRENIPLTKRVTAYVGMMLASGYTRDQVWNFLTPEEQVAFAR